MEQFRRPGLTFDVRDGGPPDGEAVVLLHGFPQDSASWALIEPPLHDAGLRTLAPDQRGYSPGARPVGRRAYTTSELADDIIALLDAAFVTAAHVVGHDWGGAVAWTLAGSHPERLRTLTVLSTPHPAAMARSLRTSTQALRSWYMGVAQVPWVPEHLLPRIMRPMLTRSGLPAASAERYAARFATPENVRGPVSWYRALPLSVRAPAHRVTVPTTYVWGRHDAFLGRTAAELTANFVAAPYRFVELDANHWLPETQAPDVARLILEQVEG
jgi:pimeloyl-ACP methyl ester carboxylesterase